tara:strand:+ start:296 stop:742 length:447 start_codon:yes stop_codon:yes gene_type:complete
MLRNNNENKISSIIGPEVEVDGDVKVVGSILIYGKINGSVSATGSVRTVKGSLIKGNIESKDANISGRVDGDLKVENKTVLETNCILNGNLTTRIVVIEEGAAFEGLCNMMNPKAKSEEKEIELDDAKSEEKEIQSDNFESSIINQDD